MSLPNATPTFGAGEDLTARGPFKVVALYTREKPDGGWERSHHVWDFEGYTDPGSGPIFRFSASGAGEAAQVQAASALIIATLVPDDAPAPAVAVITEGGEPVEDAPAADVLADSPEDLARLSSYDRFRRLMNSPHWRVPSKVLIEMAEFITKNSGLVSPERPTQSPAR